MARMPTFEEIRDDFRRGVRTAENDAEHWAGNLFQRHPQTSAAPAAAAVTIKATTGGSPVSLATDLKNFAGRLETIGEDVVSKVEAVKATPAGDEIINIVAGLVKNEAASILPAGTVNNLLATLRGIDSLAQPYIAAFEQQHAQDAQQPEQAAVPSFTPAGPQVAGQAQG